MSVRQGIVNRGTFVKKTGGGGYCGSTSMALKVA